MTGEIPSAAVRENTGGFWVRQRSAEGAAIINAKSSRQQGAELGGVSVYTFDTDGQFQERIEAKSATLDQGYWRFDDARIYASGNPPAMQSSYRLATNLTLEQVRESFATPETVPFWQLPSYIELADRAGLVAAGYRPQYQQLLSRPFLPKATVLLCRLGKPRACSVQCRRWCSAGSPPASRRSRRQFTTRVPGNPWPGYVAA